jgi:hypothetical protein
VWYQLAEEYFLAFLPLTLILMGRQLGKWLNRHQMATVLACLAMLVASAMWTRGLLASSEACWRGAEFVLSTGAQPNQVYGCEFWFGYYRFYDYVAEVPDPTVGFPDDFFGRWMSEQRQQAQFWVTETLYVPTDEKWEVLKEIPYRDILLREGRVYVLRRQGRDH